MNPDLLVEAQLVMQQLNSPHFFTPLMEKAWMTVTDGSEFTPEWRMPAP